jgi:mannose/fructose/N-acetylgalactosamine-specific phosphotransferase system component IIB
MINLRGLPPLHPSLIRIDNRLVHGQILEAWVPFISASHMVVVNDDVANDLFRESVIKMAVPREIEMRVYSIEKFSRGLAYECYTEKKSIILFSAIEDLLRAYRLGFRFDRLNLGNVHSDDCICQPTTSISLNESNVKDLMLLADSGVKIEIRCVPRDRPVDFLEVVKKQCNSTYNFHDRP